MMRLQTLVFFLLVQVTRGSVQNDVTVLGRSWLAGGGINMAFPGSVQGSFTGQSVVLSANGGTRNGNSNSFHVFLSNSLADLETEEKRIVTFAALPSVITAQTSGTWYFSIMKATSYMYGVFTLWSVVAGAGTTLNSPPAPPALMVEAYGDSITCGGDARACGQSDWFDTILYQWRLMKGTGDVELRVICENGATTEQIKNVRASADFNPPSAWSAGSIQTPTDYSTKFPDAIIINLGTNDGGDVAPHYSALLSSLRTERNPGGSPPPIFLLCGPLSGQFEDSVANVKAEIQVAGLSISPILVPDASTPGQAWSRVLKNSELSVCLVSHPNKIGSYRCARAVLPCACFGATTGPGYKDCDATVCAAGGAKDPSSGGGGGGGGCVADYVGSFQVPEWGSTSNCAWGIQAYCSASPTLQEKCCATCQTTTTPKSLCTDSPSPFNVVEWGATATSQCSWNWDPALYCTVNSFAEHCCSKCQSYQPPTTAAPSPGCVDSTAPFTVPEWGGPTVACSWNWQPASYCHAQTIATNCCEKCGGSTQSNACVDNLATFPVPEWGIESACSWISYGSSIYCNTATIRSQCCATCEFPLLATLTADSVGEVFVPEFAGGKVTCAEASTTGNWGTDPNASLCSLPSVEAQCCQSCGSCGSGGTGSTTTGATNQTTTGTTTTQARVGQVNGAARAAALAAGLWAIFVLHV